MCHIVSNLIQDAEEGSSGWAAWCVGSCIKGARCAALASLFSAQLASITKLWRWGTVTAVLSILLRRQSCLQIAWNPKRVQDWDGEGELAPDQGARKEESDEHPFSI